MPKRPPHSKLTNGARLSIALMERVGAMLRKSPPKDLTRACEIMKEERGAFFDKQNPKYQPERDALAKGTNENLVLIVIAANCADRILAHEDALVAAAAQATAAKITEGVAP